MGFVQDGGWVIDFSMAGEGQNGEYLWPPQVVRDHPNSSGVGVDRPCKEVYHNERSSSKKRSHDEVGTEPRSKACREKLRRDRLNDRFLELCSVLDPGGTPKSDKVAILSDAAQHAIKSTSMPSTFVAHPASAYHAAALAENTKAVVYPNYSPVAMWQWIPPAVLDTSHDHVLRPPAFTELICCLEMPMVTFLSNKADLASSFKKTHAFLVESFLRNSEKEER
ncbi:Transcription factor [Nymphaea thermarum]|nr:Transcription factor [Nymphaea thermarum]